MMITYNHERFIGQAIESVLRQETPFDYEVVIGEDRSTDQTSEIVRAFACRHPDRIRAILRPRNIGMHANFIETYLACQGDYVAVLEGDDYWTSPHKLQKQVAFLDEHPDCPLCFHKVQVVTDGSESATSPGHPEDIQRQVGLPEILAANIVPTASILCRNGIVADLPAWVAVLKMTDWPFCLLHALHGPLGFINESMAAYRIHHGGAWSQLSPLQQLEARLAFYERIGPVLGTEFRTLVDHCLYSTCYCLSLHHRKANNENDARGYARRCLRTSPSLEPWKSNLRMLIWAAPRSISNTLACVLPARVKFGHLKALEER
jgi:glycosyltransferase involved in cell wall biosynthesis